MSDCGCSDSSWNGYLTASNPCSPPNNSYEEGIASAISNLELNLFGILTKTIVNGRATWTAPCGTGGSIAAVPRGTSEGFICYILRLISLLGFYWQGEWNNSTQYQIGDVVLNGGNNNILYVCIAVPPIGNAPTNLTYWNLFLNAPQGLQGPAGPQGIPGSPGSSGTPAYAFTTATTTYTATNTDAVIFAEPASGAFNITLPLMSGLSAGKYYIIRTNGSSAVTILPTSTDTINGVSSYTMSLAGEAIQLVSKNSGNWFII